MYLGQSRRAVPSWPAPEPPPPSNSACWIRADITAPHRPLTCGNCPVVQDLHDLRGNQPNLAHGGPGRGRRRRATLFAAVRCARGSCGRPGRTVPCPTGPGKAAHRLARAEMYPSCTRDGPGRAELLTARSRMPPDLDPPRAATRDPRAPPVPEERMCVPGPRPIPWPPGTRTTTQARPRDATCGYRAT